MMAFKLLAMAEQRWRRIRSPHRVQQILDTIKFVDGEPVANVAQEGRKRAA